ncbi:DUF4189 domain-containing protein [Paraburkholderia agricolaris]
MPGCNPASCKLSRLDRGRDTWLTVGAPWRPISPKAFGGAAASQMDRDMAKQGVIRDCKAHGGLICDVRFTFFNQCAALVVGSPGSQYASVTLDASVAEVQEKGMKSCTDSGTICQVLYSGCSHSSMGKLVDGIAQSLVFVDLSASARVNGVRHLEATARMSIALGDGGRSARSAPMERDAIHRYVVFNGCNRR